MNREFLFRGKRADNKEWVEGDLIMVYNHDTSMPNEWIPAIKPLVKELIEVIPETVGQFTGLADNNGVKIFEGDILKADSWRFYWIVQFDDKRARFNCIINPQGNCNDFIPVNKVKVIGNIHDNSNLLK